MVKPHGPPWLTMVDHLYNIKVNVTTTLLCIWSINFVTLMYLNNDVSLLFTMVNDVFFNINVGLTLTLM